MNIYLKKGIDDLKFGMKRHEVEQMIGKPDRVIKDPDNDNELIWEYNDLKLRITFYNDENGRLGYFQSSNSDLTINDHKIIDEKVEDAMSHIDPGPGSWKKEDFVLFTTYFNEENWLTLNVEYERVTFLELGVSYKDEEDYDWPE